MPLKDFGAEVRPALDVNQFLDQSILVLDEDCPSSPLDLAVFLLKQMKLSAAVVEEAKLLLFTHDTGKAQWKAISSFDSFNGINERCFAFQVPTIARTIQATYSNQDETGCFEYDQSWLCAL